MLTLDHIIIRSADPTATLATLSQRGGLPVLAEATQVGGLTSAIVRAGAVDIEVLAIGDDPPDRPHGYGLGFVADRPITEALTEIRAAGLPTSAPISARAGSGPDLRRWRAAQIGDLLPGSFPISMSTRRPGVTDRLSERFGSTLARIPAVARAATRTAGASMVVVTEYGFDAGAYRASSPVGPELLEVRVNTGDRLDAWSRLPLARSSLLRLDTAGSPPLLGVVLAAHGEATPKDFACGDVTFTFQSNADRVNPA
jgi:hypothetical protein